MDMLSKKRKLGRLISDISIGEKLVLTEAIEDRDLLLYLGLTNDANPLYIQHDYASQTPWKRPIVPAIMLTGIITSAVSKYLPGPGSHIVSQTIEFKRPVYHYEHVEFLFEVTSVDEENNEIHISVQAIRDGEEILVGSLRVVPPYPFVEEKALDNF
ncbi:MaoC/PaaZ C-terminal domain-containing protein [Anoxybacillus kestanbolensis]|uniref:MaoC/PaaZ C-terminal domain-containing protein n=1 Tax=Anoxybacillus kestanbolensis TaxID=227476 RepID=UPI003D1A48E1